VSPSGSIPPAESLFLESLLAVPEAGIASRVLARAAGGSVTLFTFAEGDELSEHSTPLDALALVLGGAIDITIGGKPVAASAGTITRLPATVPHALVAREASRLLLIMLRA
jgi:quercetin dioxygenase-like cupin family protein